MITKAQAVHLTYRQELHHTTLTSRDGSPVRCRVNGKCTTWKTRPDDFRLPVKHGFRECFYITPLNADQWQLPSQETD